MLALEIGLIGEMSDKTPASEYGYGNCLMSAHGIMFHHFYDNRHPKGQGAISATELLQVLDHLGHQRILPAEEWIRRAQNEDLDDDALCLTFDDALRCQYDVAFPVLRDLGMTACWFVYSSVFEGGAEPLEVYRYFRTIAFRSIDQFYESFFRAVSNAYASEYETTMAGFQPETYLARFPFYTRNDRIFRYLRDDVLGAVRYNEVMCTLMARQGFDQQEVVNSLWMTDEHLRTLRGAGHVIGLHSHTHPTRIDRAPVATQRSEYQRNFSHLRRVLGEEPTTMAHPSNSYSAETLGILRGLGIRLGFRANMAPIADRSPLEVPREDHANIMTAM